MGEPELKTLLIFRELEIPVHHDLDLELAVIGRCSKCEELINITDVITVYDNVFIEVEPHTCTE